MTEAKSLSDASQTLPLAEQTALLGRILASTQFRRAARLRELLVFVLEHSARPGAPPIHEQEIGSAVFDRPAGYDTGVDNIVRVNATELRKRLDLYFSEDGAQEPVVLEMPRGSYSVVFRPRAAQAETSPPPPLPEPAATMPAEAAPVAAPPAVPATDPALALPSRHRAAVLWPVAAVVLLLACGGLFWQNVRLRHQVSPWRNGVALHRFWSEFLDSGQQVDIILADTSFSLAEDVEGRSIPLASYLNYEYKRLDTLSGLSPDRREDLQNVLDRNNGSVGDYIVAERLLALEHAAPTFHLNFAREYSAEAIKTNSVILIGSRQSNPWVQLYDNRMNFSMDYDPALHRSIVHNRQPSPGEQAEYVFTAGSHEQGFSVIAFMPDLSRSGNALIIEGTDSQATRSAGEFVTGNDSLSAFLSLIRSKDFPYFEILLENSELTGTPLGSHILAYRLYPRTGSGPA